MQSAKKKNPLPSRQGFTLIEVMITLLVLSIGILAAGTMQVSALRGNSHAKQLSLAVVWGGDRLETLMAKSYDDAEIKEKKSTATVVAGLDYTDVATQTADYKDVIDDGNGATFTIFWNIADDYPVLGCKTIRVLVRRNDRGTSRTTSMDFIKMKPI